MATAIEANTMLTHAGPRVAFVGGKSFMAAELDKLLSHAVSIGASIVTGSGQGVEDHVRDWCNRHNVSFVLPQLDHDTYGPAARNCQVNDVLKEADVMVIGEGSRGKIALDIWKRLNLCRNPPNRTKLVSLK